MRLGDLDALKEKLQARHDFIVNAWGGFSGLPQKYKARVDEITNCIAEVVNSPTIDAVPVVRIEQAKDEILSRMSEFITEYRLYSESTVDHFGGKADAMDVAKRLVNAVLTDLCSHGERKDGEG